MNNTIDKLGIFGWTGTGKTTYISMFQHLVSYGEHPYIISSFVDNQDIENNIYTFLGADNWNDVTTNIVGTEYSSDILFTINTEDGKKKFFIRDYKGERIFEDRYANKEKKEKKNIYEYFIGCSAILLFLDSELFEEESQENKKIRWNEFHTILHKLSEESNSDIPIYLVITKSDIVDINNKSQGTFDLANDKYKKIMVLMKDRREPFFVSTKACFKNYIQNNKIDKERKQEEIEEIKNFCSPVLFALESINNIKKNDKERKRKQKKIYEESIRKRKNKIIAKKISGMLFVFVFVFVLIYTYYYFNFNNKISIIVLSSENHIKELRLLNKNNPYLYFYPMLETKIKNKLENKMNDDFNEIEKTAKKMTNYNGVFKLINDFETQFPNKKIKEIQKINNAIKIYLFDSIKEFNKMNSLIEINNLQEKISFFKKYFLHSELIVDVIDIEKIINKKKEKYLYSAIKKSNDLKVMGLISEYIDSYPDGKYFKKVEKFKKGGELVNEIQGQEEENTGIIVNLCREYNELRIKKFGAKIKKRCTKKQKKLDKIEKIIFRITDEDIIVSKCEHYYGLEMPPKIETRCKNAETIQNCRKGFWSLFCGSIKK